MLTVLTSTQQEMAECVFSFLADWNKCWLDIRASMCFRIRFNAETDADYYDAGCWHTEVDSLCQGLNEFTQTIASFCVSKKVNQ
jgi:hypothetical protein